MHETRIFKMRDIFRKNTFWLVSITALLVICVFLAFFASNGDDTMDSVVGVVAIASGIGSVVMGVSSIFSTSLDNVREYYATGDSDAMCEARGVLYNYRYIKIKYGKTVFDEDFDEWAEKLPEGAGVAHRTSKKEIFAAASTTNDFFQMWGLLQSKNFLPMWVFETASGYSIIKLHEALDDINTANRATNPFYGLQFRDLCVRIAGKYKKAIAKCRENEAEFIKNNLKIKDLTDNKFFNIPLK